MFCLCDSSIIISVCIIVCSWHRDSVYCVFMASKFCILCVHGIEILYIVCSWHRDFVYCVFMASRFCILYSAWLCLSDLCVVCCMVMPELSIIFILFAEAVFSNPLLL